MLCLWHPGIQNCITLVLSCGRFQKPFAFNIVASEIQRRRGCYDPAIAYLLEVLVSVKDIELGAPRLPIYRLRNNVRNQHSFAHNVRRRKR